MERLDCLTVRSRIAVRVGVAALLVGCFAPPGAAQADPAPVPPPSPGPAPGPANVGIDKDGNYAVGTDIAPGTYSSAGPVEGGACYWKRSAGDKVVDNAMSKKPQIVRIEATDTSFKTSDCQPWQRIEDCLPGCGPAAPNPADLLGQLGRMVLSNPGVPPAGGTP